MPIVVSSGKRSADRLQQGESGRAASGGVDDKIRSDRLARALAILAAHAGDRLSIWRRPHFRDPAALAQHDVGEAFHPTPHDALDGGP